MKWEQILSFMFCLQPSATPWESTWKVFLNPRKPFSMKLPQTVVFKACPFKVISNSKFLNDFIQNNIYPLHNNIYNTTA